MGTGSRRGLFKNRVTSALGTLKVGPPERMGRISLFPVVRAGNTTRMNILTLRKALDRRMVNLYDQKTGRRARLEDEELAEYLYVEEGQVLNGGGTGRGRPYALQHRWHIGGYRRG